jgi:hypothetical protein
MYILFGGNIYQQHLGAYSIICFVENRDYVLELASKYIFEGLKKEESWCHVYDINNKTIIWEKTERKIITKSFKKNI